MNKSIEKFIKIVEDDNLDLEKEIFILLHRRDSVSEKKLKHLLELFRNRNQFLKYFIKAFIEEKELLEIFVNFIEVSNFLENSNLKLKEKFDVIFSLVEKNINIGILNISDFYFSMDIIRSYNFKKVTFEDIVAFASSEKYRNIKEDSILTEKERAIYDEMLNISKLSIDHIKPLVEGHDILNKYLLSKLPDVKKEDIPIIMEGFEKLGISQKILQDLEMYLNNLASKRKDIIKPVEVKKEIEVRLSNKELRALNRKLSYYYDLDHDKAIRVLSLDEELYVISIMQRLGYSKEVMRNILNKINMLSNINPIVLYDRLYDKYASYKENEKVKELLEELEMYFQNMFMCDSEEYAINKMCFYDTFNKLIMLIPNDYEYEFSQVLNLKR